MQRRRGRSYLRATLHTTGPSSALRPSLDPGGCHFHHHFLPTSLRVPLHPSSVHEGEAGHELGRPHSWPSSSGMGALGRQKVTERPSSQSRWLSNRRHSRYPHHGLAQFDSAHPSLAQAAKGYLPNNGISTIPSSPAPFRVQPVGCPLEPPTSGSAVVRRSQRHTTRFVSVERV